MTGHDVVYMESHCVLLTKFYPVSDTWIVRIEIKYNIYYRIIALLQEFHKFISTQQRRLLSFRFKTPRAYCTSHYPAPIACPLAHLLFSLFPFIIHLSLEECWSEIIHWENLEPWYIVPHIHQLLPFKNRLQLCRGTWIILPWQPLSIWFSIEHHYSLEFFCCAILLQNDYSLMSPSLILLCQIFNIYRIKTLLPIKLVHILCQHITPFSSKPSSSFMHKIPLCKSWTFFHFIIS